MAPRNLYLHELIDIVGQGQYDYMDHSRKEPTNVMPDMLTLQGTFFVCAVGGGRWPQVVNLWDVGAAGWQGWASNVDRLNLKRRNAFYGDWWDEASKWRTGGFDRLCGGVPGSPTTTEIAERGVSGTLFVHQLLTVRPGSPLDYLAEVVEQQVPLWQEYGHEPTGIYEVLGNQHEVVVVWATSIAAQTRMRANRDAARGLADDGEADERLVAWERASAAYVTGGETQLMTPLPGTVYGPEAWDEATLDDWLAPPDA
ncbi:hypothetical protein BH10ACT1_BH10ACT1_19400 [soil metagenome]